MYADLSEGLIILYFSITKVLPLVSREGELALKEIAILANIKLSQQTCTASLHDGPNDSFETPLIVEHIPNPQVPLGPCPSGRFSMLNDP